MTSKPGTTVIIIKKKSGGGHAAHHGGAWKVAYADFVTAMMAFFLLLWLLNVTTQDQKRAIANYFDPTSASDSTSGSGGVLGGTSMLSPGAELSDTKPIGTSIPEPGDPAAASDPKNSTLAANQQQQDAGQGSASDKSKNAIAEIEDKNFKQAEAAIKQAIQSVPELQAVAQNLLVDETPEGLRIQIVDQDGSSMFPSGGSEMFDKTRKLLAAVVQAIQKMPNQITVRGHTDSTPYHSAKGYSNWDLSSDRANATRRVLVESGLDPDRIASVVGKADKEPMFPENPEAPENRRISIILLRASVANATGDTAAAPMGKVQK
jgi:chemotaxis protein MotB